MIDIVSGNICFQNINQKLIARMMKEEFLISSLNNFVIRDDSHSNASIYVLNPMKLWGEKINVSLIFDKSNMLYMVQISLFREKIKTWDNWSENEEKQLKLKHDNILEKNIGKPPYIYKWGMIGSTYDPRSGSSFITIKYDDY